MSFIHLLTYIHFPVVADTKPLGLVSKKIRQFMREKRSSRFLTKFVENNESELEKLNGSKGKNVSRYVVLTTRSF